MNKHFQSPDGFIAVGKPAKRGQPSWVRCEHSMYLAVLDESGKWKSFSNNRELTDVVEVEAG
jgi:hypothetical protein